MALGVLARDDVLEVASALALLPPAVDESGVNAVADAEMGEGMPSSPSGVARRSKESLSSWTCNKLNHGHKGECTPHTKPKAPSPPCPSPPISTENASSANSCPGSEETVYGLKFGNVRQ